jgi:hypothetical protein
VRSCTSRSSFHSRSRERGQRSVPSRASRTSPGRDREARQASAESWPGDCRPARGQAVLTKIATSTSAPWTFARVSASSRSRWHHFLSQLTRQELQILGDIWHRLLTQHTRDMPLQRTTVHQAVRS